MVVPIWHVSVCIILEQLAGSKLLRQKLLGANYFAKSGASAPG
jgi:hypothetical protein